MNISELIVQDDTGVPWRILKKAGWQVAFHGHYVSPYGREFAPYFQKDLHSLFAGKATAEKLGFCFGYGCGKADQVVMVCQKNTASEKITPLPGS